MYALLALVAPLAAAPVTETFTQTADEVDVVFAVDGSGSMMDDISGFTASFAMLTETLDDYGIDYHMAAVMEDGGCVVGADLYIDDTFNAYDAEDAMEVMVSGFSGADAERGFTLLSDAVFEAFPGAGGCNDGLLRLGADLHFVGLTDEPEQSAKPWLYYVNRYGQATYHAVAGEYPAGCASASPAEGWWQATEASEGLFTSICGVDWEQAMEDLGVVTAQAALDARFYLSDVPAFGTISVTVDGVTSTDWTFRPVENAVVFAEDAIPANGSTVEIGYEVY